MDDRETVLGIEFGSTRIKAVLIDRRGAVLAQGSFGWENELVDGMWSYGLDRVEDGLRACYADLKKEVRSRYGVTLRRPSAIGISAMMHGYLAFDRDMRLLVPFRTWRNTVTGEAAKALTERFSFPIPQRWSVAHLYQAMLRREPHVPAIAHLHTLASYVHWRLTGRDVIGVDDASGMFPIDPATGTYDAGMRERFDALAAGLPWRVGDVLPTVLPAGASAGTLTKEGALLLDPSGDLEPGCPLCPPEGDAATGMVATHSIAPRTGNVSAGTSAFAMVVLEHPLEKVWQDKIDLVMTPDGRPCAMSHANNCTGAYDRWIGLFVEAARALGSPVSKDEAYGKLLPLALRGAADCGGIIPFGYLSGEAMTEVPSGRPLVVCRTEHAFALPEFLRAQLCSSLCALRAGMDILFEKEHVRLDVLMGHGGFFKTPDVGQRLMAAAMKVPVGVMRTAGEGGAWGIALLASYLVHGGGRSLAAFLDEDVFASVAVSTVAPEAADMAGFDRFYAAYLRALPLEREAASFVD